jgi:outer membrane protein
MKKSINFFFLFLFLFSLDKVYAAEIKISFIDVDYIYSNSKIGKKINNQLDTDKKKIDDEFSGYQKKIQDEKEKLISQKNILSEEEFRNKSINLEKNVKKYNKLISDNNKKFIKYKSQTKVIFLKKLMNIVQVYAENNSIQLVLNKKDIIIGQNTMDISNDVLELVNKKMNDIKLK